MIQVNFVDDAGVYHYRSYTYKELYEVQALSKAYARVRGWHVLSVVKLY